MITEIDGRFLVDNVTGGLWSAPAKWPQLNTSIFISLKSLLLFEFNRERIDSL